VFTEIVLALFYSAKGYMIKYYATLRQIQSTVVLMFLFLFYFTRALCRCL